MNDVHISSGAYALNALDEQERAVCEAHLTQCAECRAEVASFVNTATQLASTTEITPPPELRSRVLSGISQVRPLPPLDAGKHRAAEVEAEVEVEAEPSPANVVPIRRQRWVPRLVAAAAVVVALGGGAAVWHPWDNASNQQALSPVDQVLRAPDAVKQTKHLAIGGEATVVRSVSQRRAVMTVSDLPVAPSGKTYELWLQTPTGTMVPAGIMHGTSMVLAGDATKAVGAGITIEPAAGSSSPTTPPVALFVFGPAR
jgi:anti-sigma factor RsiW